MLEVLQEEIVTCSRCTRLREHCAAVAAAKRRAYRDEEYWGRPVPAFGDPLARVLVLGLAEWSEGRFPEAEAHLREALDRHSKASGGEPLACLRLLSVFLIEQQQFSKLLEVLDQSHGVRGNREERAWLLQVEMSLRLILGDQTGARGVLDLHGPRSPAAP